MHWHLLTAQLQPLHNFKVIIQMPAGIGGEQVDELQVKLTHIAVHEAAVFVKNAGEAPTLGRSEERAGGWARTGKRGLLFG
jgi:hypothetical protein